MKTNRENIINAIVDLSGEELDVLDWITIAKEDEDELTIRLIGIAEYFRNELNN